MHRARSNPLIFQNELPALVLTPRGMWGRLLTMQITLIKNITP